MTFAVSRRDGEALRAAPPSAGAWPVLRSIGDSGVDNANGDGAAIPAGTAEPAGSGRQLL